MTDTKISALPAASSAAGTDEIPANQSGTTRKVTLTQALAFVFGTSATVTEGYGFTADADGTKSSGTYTPTFAGGNYKTITNGGAFTLAAPSADCSLVVQVTNNGSAGAITFSGFTVGSNTGDTLDTTNAHVFRIYIERIDGVSSYSIKALQ